MFLCPTLLLLHENPGIALVTAVLARTMCVSLRTHAHTAASAVAREPPRNHTYTHTRTQSDTQLTANTHTQSDTQLTAHPQRTAGRVRTRTQHRRPHCRRRRRHTAQINSTTAQPFAAEHTGKGRNLLWKEHQRCGRRRQRCGL